MFDQDVSKFYRTYNIVLN